MDYVEIELDGVIATKRCPRFRTATLDVDLKAIRAYFSELGYMVGTYLRVL